MSRGEVAPIYQFGEGVLEPQDLHDIGYAHPGTGLCASDRTRCGRPLPRYVCGSISYLNRVSESSIAVDRTSRLSRLSISPSQRVPPRAPFCVLEHRRRRRGVAKPKPQLRALDVQRARVADESQLNIDQRQRCDEVAARGLNRLDVVEHPHRHVVRGCRHQRVRRRGVQGSPLQAADRLRLSSTSMAFSGSINVSSARNREVSGEVDALRGHTQRSANHQVRNAQRNRNAAARTQHAVDAARFERLAVRRHP